MSEVIRVENLTKVFVSNWKRRKTRAVDGLSFSVHEGEVCGFLGPNGAGKTTTLKMLFGLLRPTSGSATIFGDGGGERTFGGTPGSCLRIPTSTTT